jgi:hypothetical protein
MPEFSKTTTSSEQDSILSMINTHLSNYPNAQFAVKKTLESPFHETSDILIHYSLQVCQDDDGNKYVNSTDCWDSNSFTKNVSLHKIYLELYDDDVTKYGGKIIYKLKSGLLPIGGMEMDFVDAITNPSISCTTSVTKLGNNYLLNFWDPTKSSTMFTHYVAISTTVDSVGFPWNEDNESKPHIPDTCNIRFTIGALAYEISCRKDDPNKPFKRVNWNNNVDTDIDILLRKLNTDIVKVFCRFGNPPNA